MGLKRVNGDPGNGVQPLGSLLKLGLVSAEPAVSHDRGRWGEGTELMLFSALRFDGNGPPRSDGNARAQRGERRPREPGDLSSRPFWRKRPSRAPR